MTLGSIFEENILQLPIFVGETVAWLVTPMLHVFIIHIHISMGSLFLTIMEQMSIQSGGSVPLVRTMETANLQ